MWEVVYPTSRAVELGAEDEEEEKCILHSSVQPTIRMSNELQSEDKTVSCKLLVFAFERIPAMFIEAHFINSQSQIVGLVSGGEVKEACINSLLQTASSDKTCFIHSAIPSVGFNGNEVLFCQCKVDIPPEACHDWANKVLSCIKAEKVVILSVLPASVCLLKCHLDLNFDHLFALKTDSWESSPICPFLQPPNIVSSLPAAVLSHCQIFNIPAIMYLAVTATDGILDSTVVDVFNALLDCKPLKNIPKCSRSETTRFLKSVKITSPHINSNMYI